MTGEPFEIRRAGVSDKYGMVYVEKFGNTGFDDPTEQIALFRAQDKWALDVLKYYLARLRSDPEVPIEQIRSVERQIAAFTKWRNFNQDKVRTPGVKA